ncbi:related to Putative zinc metalloproteinase YIL108W [Saccharomycodes ludwigii]|uniref:Related to Putative zinc metalloproteinase YIL108W n=1 Tax=Saccharomycodes ludwigii TaxID=36035 RepID=A0A376B6R4_9ASCO|nr:hypothetical protein SCDLUD_002780 [Saccharomycodes ludwigii]KAH3901289.1 hypothetical protein SCDLUD_002780 [Saccharomycodes ludwigii]SSD60375.1 related to Putative zinc metalloproteinase YIL108W [Saccharomycodes ludwigii]
MSISLINLQDNQELHSPCIIVHGQINNTQGNYTEKNIEGFQEIVISSLQLPPLKYQINARLFKATIQLTPGLNNLRFTSKNSKTGEILLKNIVCQYVPLLQDIPIHLCLLVGKDSKYLFDSPSTKIDTQTNNGLNVAIKKLRMGARLMQAYTNEQMYRNGFGQRTFQFVEEWNTDYLFKQYGPQGKLSSTIKVHILHSDKTVKELRDPNLAQQNPKGTNTGGLFPIAMDALRKYENGRLLHDNEKPLQAAVMFLDTHWDKSSKLLLTHAALGGGTEDIKLAIFGSHGLYSWPTCYEEITSSFTDENTAGIGDLVANDNGECGSYWECLCVTLGAFMHEIGHSLGCPHQESGVMLRDYPVLNRSFLSKEAYSTRKKNNGLTPPIYPKDECAWHRLDLLRFLYHPSFTLPKDYEDPSFMRPGKLAQFNYAAPTLLPVNSPGLFTLKSPTGIYSIEIISGDKDDLARGFIEYLPVSVGGQGPQQEIMISIDDLRTRLPPDKRNDTISLRVLAVNSPQAEFKNLKKLSEQSFVNLGSPSITGLKSGCCGNGTDGKDPGVLTIDVERCIGVRVYHGGALDGIGFHYTSNKEPDYVFGNKTNNFTTVIFERADKLLGFNVKCGCWIDALQVITVKKGAVTPMLGNCNGGHQETLIPPTGHRLLGVYGRIGQWINGIGIVYSV